MFTCELFPFSEQGEFSTVELRMNAPGQQANNDLQTVTVGVKPTSVLMTGCLAGGAPYAFTQRWFVWY
jgi:hypothetical protein